MAKHSYEPWEVSLFKENKNKGKWVVEYKGSGQYFDTFDDAALYIKERHANDSKFATKNAM